MDILFQISDWIKVIGSVASVGLAVYFIVKFFRTKNIAKKPLKDAKKREKMMKEFAILSKELGIVPEKDAKKDEKVS